jgi:hypothetical protein
MMSALGVKQSFLKAFACHLRLTLDLLSPYGG